MGIMRRPILAFGEGVVPVGVGLCRVPTARRRRGSRAPTPPRVLQVWQVWQVWQVVPIVISIHFFLHLKLFFALLFGKVLEKAATPVTVLRFPHKRAALDVATSCNNLPPTCNTPQFFCTEILRSVTRWLCCVAGYLSSCNPR